MILAAGHEGTAAVTAALLSLLTDHHFGQWHQDPCGEPIPPTGSPPRTTTTTPGIHEIRHPSRPPPRRLPRCPMLRCDHFVLEMIVIRMIGRPSGPRERKWACQGR
ncbi:Protein of unknown function (part1) [Mycobacterium canettii CIPT 140070010]|nr:Protein of unknown function (part1) [Mycobacterium canettii CIPT 140070010]